MVWAPAPRAHPMRPCHRPALAQRAPPPTCRRSSSSSGTMTRTRAQAAAAVPAPSESGKRIVILGGGIIGAATAHYLAEMGAGPRTTIVERHEVACAASGKAGGFLAKDWDQRRSTRAFTRTSYELHAQLAAQFGAERVGYRPVHTLSVCGTERAPGTRPSVPGQKLPSWLDGNVLEAAALGSPHTTAQVHPFKLTTALMAHATEQGGARLVKGVATGLEKSQDGPRTRVTGVRVGDTTLPCDVVVLAMGPWTDIAAREWGLALPRIVGQKAHSIVVQPSQPTSAHCVFTSFAYASGTEADPELYPRPDGTVYVCGESQMVQPPEDPAQIEPDRSLCARLATVGASLSSALQGAEVTTQQAYFLPIGPDGTPVIGAVSGCEGVYVGAGHSCWGILHAPATGKALAELICDGAAQCVDLGPFSPARFATA